MLGPRAESGMPNCKKETATFYQLNFFLSLAPFKLILPQLCSMIIGDKLLIFPRVVVLVVVVAGCWLMLMKLIGE